MYNKIVMKKIGFLFLILLSTMSFSQEKGKFRTNLDLGYAAPSNGGGGVSIYLEPMYNIKDNISIGIRIGAPVLFKKIEFSDGETSETTGDTHISFIATFDYHFNKTNSSLTPFMGAGIGYVLMPNIGFDRFSDIDDKTQYNGKVNGMIRGGFEWKKFRFSLDYNFIPKSDLIDFNGDKIGFSKNSYFGVNLGFFVGGGKW